LFPLAKAFDNKVRPAPENSRNDATKVQPFTGTAEAGGEIRHPSGTGPSNLGSTTSESPPILDRPSQEDTTAKPVTALIPQFSNPVTTLEDKAAEDDGTLVVLTLASVVMEGGGEGGSAHQNSISKHKNTPI
jgi:hypothetical protein